MRLAELYAEVLDRFERDNPEPKTELNYRTPFELLVAVILSAQCTDKRVNMVTPNIFALYPDAETMSKADTEEIFEIIKSISYPNNKAKHLKKTAEIIANEYDNEVPIDFNALLALPGVGRKTANVVTSVIEGQPRMAVDTHVFRVSKRIGLVPEKASFLATEQRLVKYIPEDKIHMAHHWIILHGRYICKARKPDCANCNLTDLCKAYKKGLS